MHARIELVDVRCIDTEDVTGADTLYLVGAATDGVATNVVLTAPLWISGGEAKAFPPEQALLFDGELGGRRSVHLALQAYDEDAAKDWAEHGEWVMRLADAVATALEQAPRDPSDPDGKGVDPGAALGLLLRGTAQGVNLFASRDKDDLLGTLALDVPVLVARDEICEWVVRGHWAGGVFGWSRWDHRVRYRVTVTGEAPDVVVRTGGRITLGHLATAGQLHSHPFSYGHHGGSGQQQVTVFTGSDANDLWRVREAHGRGADTGRVLQDGDVLRLTHVATGRNLHSHAGFVSPVTHQQEVTCFGTSGVGDGNDDWRLEVDGGGPWLPPRRLRLVHRASGAALHSHAGHSHTTWTRGQQEVTGFAGRDDNDWWQLRGLV